MASNRVTPQSGPLSAISRLPQELKELIVLHTLIPATLLTIFWRLLSFTVPLRSHFEPDRDIPDLSDKVILVTGSNTGIGKESVLQLAKHKPAHVYIAARDESKALKAIEEIMITAPDALVTFLQLDLMSFASIQEVAKTFNSESSRLDILINNAGTFSLGRCGYTIDMTNIAFKG
jgi:hypothetical protein